MIKVDVWLKLIDELEWQHIHTNYNISTLKKLTYPHSIEHIHTLNASSRVAFATEKSREILLREGGVQKKYRGKN